MMPRLGELLLWGWLWNLTWGGYYLIIVMLASWIMLMRNKITIFNSLILSFLTALCALILYSATMAVVDFFESLLLVHYTYAEPAQSWIPGCTFFILFSLLQTICFLLVRHRYQLSFNMIIKIVLLSNICALVLASLMQPLVLR